MGQTCWFYHKVEEFAIASIRRTPVKNKSTFKHSLARIHSTTMTFRFPSKAIDCAQPQDPAPSRPVAGPRPHRSSLVEHAGRRSCKDMASHAEDCESSVHRPAHGWTRRAYKDTASRVKIVSHPCTGYTSNVVGSGHALMHRCGVGCKPCRLRGLRACTTEAVSQSSSVPSQYLQARVFGMVTAGVCNWGRAGTTCQSRWHNVGNLGVTPHRAPPRAPTR